MGTLLWLGRTGSLWILATPSDQARRAFMDAVAPPDAPARRQSSERPGAETSRMRRLRAMRLSVCAAAVAGTVALGLRANAEHRLSVGALTAPSIVVKK